MVCFEYQSNIVYNELSQKNVETISIRRSFGKHDGLFIL